MRDGIEGGLGVEIGVFEGRGDLVEGLADAGVGAAHGFFGGVEEWIKGVVCDAIDCSRCEVIKYE